MIEAAFVIVLAAAMATLLHWGFRELPRERWQFLASVPVSRAAGGAWQAVNYTFYGFFIACSLGLALAISFILLGAIGVPTRSTLLLLVSICAVCLPAARLVARVVEGKRFTFTVAGASFVGVIVLPALVAILNGILGPTDRISLLHAAGSIAVAFALGEGIGRLACVSFGCCYGRPVESCPPLLRKIFARRNFVFSGVTKKACYEGHMEACEVVPIQAVTAIVNTAAGLIGLTLYLLGCPRAALLTAMGLTQLWRFASEFLRADYRGGRKISAYQYMSLTMITIVVAMCLGADAPPAYKPQILSGLRIMWDPTIILTLQALWVTAFLYTGRSMVTGAHLAFHVVRDRI